MADSNRRLASESQDQMASRDIHFSEPTGRSSSPQTWSDDVVTLVGTMDSTQTTNAHLVEAGAFNPEALFQHLDPSDEHQGQPGSSQAEVNFAFADTSGVISDQPDEVEDEKLPLEADDIEEGDIPVSYHNAHILNESYQNSIQETIELLQMHLQNNLQRQEELDAELEELHQGNLTPMARAGLGSQERKCVTVFCAPYFKDTRGFTHPPNPDTLRKRRHQELDPFLSNPKEWSQIEKKKLILAVKEDALKERMKRAMVDWERLIAESRQKELAPDRRSLVMEELKEVKGQIDEIKAMPDEELFHNREEDFDWMKIAAQTFQEGITAKCCELMWKNMLHPTINRSSWSKEEDLSLKELSKQFGFKDWDEVAEELGTGRSGFLCFMRFQLKHNKAFEKAKWSSNEDRRLRQLVSKCRINNYIPWSKVSYYMERRTKDQCYQRYYSSLRNDIRHGAYDESEDFLILAGVKLFGEQWRIIADYMPTRTAAQVNSRYNNFLAVNLEAWDTEEDQRLLQAVKELGTNDWVKIAERTNGKNRTQCRNRFFAIYKRFLKDPGKFDLSNAKSLTNRKNRQARLLERWSKCVEEFLVKHKNPVEKEEQEDNSDSALPESDPDSIVGFHVTPDGIRIPMSALEDFMRKLRSEVKIPPPKDPFGDIIPRDTPSCSKLGMLTTRPTSVFLNTSKRGKRKLEGKRGVGRPKRSTEDFKASKEGKLKKALTFFMSPSLEYRKSRRLRTHTKTDMDKMGQSLVRLGQVLKCNESLKMDREVDRVNRDDPDEFETYLLDSYRAALAEGNPSPVIQPPGASEPKRPPQGPKTYSRKRPHSSGPMTLYAVKSEPVPSNSQPGGASVLPPQYSTLIGFRGISLYNRYLQQRASPGEQLICRNDNALLFDGIFHPDVMHSANECEETQGNNPNPGLSSVKDGSVAPEEADERLFERFKALFLWPAMMASMKTPFNLRAKEDLFEAEAAVKSKLSLQRPMSAQNPFDPTQIIAEAKSNPPARKVRLVQRKFCPPNASAIQSSPLNDCLSTTSSNPDDPVPLDANTLSLTEAQKSENH